MFFPDLEQDDKAGLPERNHQFAPPGRYLAAPTSVRSEREDVEAALDCSAEACRYRDVREFGSQFAFDEEIFQAFEVSLVTRCRREDERAQEDRGREATTARMRSAPLSARACMRVRTSLNEGPPSVSNS